MPPIFGKRQSEGGTGAIRSGLADLNQARPQGQDAAARDFKSASTQLVHALKAYAMAPLKALGAVLSRLKSQLGRGGRTAGGAGRKDTLNLGLGAMGPGAKAPPKKSRIQEIQEAKIAQATVTTRGAPARPTAGQRRADAALAHLNMMRARRGAPPFSPPPLVTPGATPPSSTGGAPATGKLLAGARLAASALSGLGTAGKVASGILAGLAAAGEKVVELGTAANPRAGETFSQTVEGFKTSAGQFLGLDKTLNEFSAGLQNLRKEMRGEIKDKKEYLKPETMLKANETLPGVGAHMPSVMSLEQHAQLFGTGSLSSSQLELQTLNDKAQAVLDELRRDSGAKSIPPWEERGRRI